MVYKFFIWVLMDFRINVFNSCIVWFLLIMIGLWIVNWIILVVGNCNVDILFKVKSFLRVMLFNMICMYIYVIDFD